MKRIPLITITPTIKVQILRSLASQKALLIPTYHKIPKKSYHIFLSQQHAQNNNCQNLASEELYGLTPKVL
jgi:hypothetical protein